MIVPSRLQILRDNSGMCLYFKDDKKYNEQIGYKRGCVSSVGYITNLQVAPSSEMHFTQKKVMKSYRCHQPIGPTDQLCRLAIRPTDQLVGQLFDQLF